MCVSFLSGVLSGGFASFREQIWFASFLEPSPVCFLGHVCPSESILVFAYENRRREMRDDMDNQRVRDVTGVDFTVGNMLQVVSPAAKGMLLGFFLGVYLSTWLFKPAFMASMYFYVYFKC